MKTSICIISFSPVRRDARVLRQISCFAPKYNITVVGYGSPPSDWDDNANKHWITIVPQPSTITDKINNLILLTKIGKIYPLLYDVWFRNHNQYLDAFTKTQSVTCDIVYANDWNALPIALEIVKRNNAKLIFDAHEYAPLEFGDDKFWMWTYPQAIDYFIRKSVSFIDRSITVAQPIAQRYLQEFGFEPVVILNAPNRVNIPQHLVDPHHIRLIHHGSAIRSRHLEAMIQTLAFCDERYTLHFMLVGDEGYIQQLKYLAQRVAPERIVFHNTVVPGEIVRSLAEYDIGFYLLKPSNYNNSVALPNKFFDFISAGLAVCIGPSPAMTQFVHQYGVGWVAASFEPQQVADLLNGLSTEQILTMRQAARDASESINAEHEMAKLADLCASLV